MVEDGFSETNRPSFKSKISRDKEKSLKSSAFSLGLPKGLSSSLQEALFELLKQHHSEDGFPVVLVIPKRVSNVKETILKLAPYKVPPRSFKHLWKEIKEKFGKTVQGLSTKNGAVDWFRRVWEEFKEEIMSKGWVSVGPSPFSFKENSSSSGLSKQLSKELPTHKEKPSNKLTERTENETTPTGAENDLERTKFVPGFPSSQVVQTALKFLEERTQGSDVVKVSREELETTIYAAWKNADPEKANRKAVSKYIDKYEGVLWRKLDNGHYGLLVSSDKVRVRIRDYVLELKQAKKNGQGQTSADRNGSVGSDTNGQGQPHTNGNGSLGSTSVPINENGKHGNGKYDIDQIIHTLQKEGKVYVPLQFVHEIAKELGRRGFSVKAWVSGLIELVGRDDDLPF
jgi:hypothetical protein